MTGFAGSESASNAAGYSAPTCSASGYSATSNAVSTFTIACSGGTATNYTFTTSATATATVVKAALSVTVDAKSVTYGGALPTLTFVVNGWLNSQSAANAAGYAAPTCSTSPSYTTTTAAGTSVSITCSGGTATNYSLASASASLTINKISSLTITAANQSITYGASTPTNSFTTSGLAAGDAITSVTYTYAGTSPSYGASTTPPTLPGSYTITPSAPVFSGSGTTSNYTTTSYVNGTYTINAGRLTITAVSPATVTYGTAIASASFVTSGLGAGSTIGSLTYMYQGTGSTIYAASTTAPTAVGSYSITPSNAQFSSGSAALYSVISYSAGFFTIAKAPLVIVPSGVSVVYGGSTPSLSFTVTGLQYSETLNTIAGYVAPTCSTAYTTTTSVLSSPVAVTCSGGSATSYTFTAGTANALTISPKTLTVSGTSIAAKKWTGTKAAGAISVGTLIGLVNGDNYTLQGMAADYASIDVGTYTTTVSYTLGSLAGSIINNYTVSNSNVSGTISPAPAVFTITPQKALAATAFAIDYTNSDTLTVSSTTNTVGVISFKVSVSGGTFTSITSCPDVAVNPSGGVTAAAICTWPNPTLGELIIRSTLTPSDLTANAIEVKEFNVLVVPKPRITSFTVKGQPAGTTSGVIGNVVIITGENFQGINDVKFNGVSALTGSFRATSTQITVTVPVGASTGKISVGTSYGGSATSAGNFTVTG